MKKFIKKNWKKIFICMSISFAFIFSFAFMPKTYAQDSPTFDNGYDILPNGLQSKNYFDNSKITQFDFTTIGNTNTQFNFELWTNQSLTHNIAAFNNNNIITNTIQEGNWYIRIGINGNNQDAKIWLPDTYYFEQGTYTININLSLNETNHKTLKNIMLVKGTQQCNYFPYGFFNGSNNYDWNNDLLQENERLKIENESLKNINFMDYLIGQNYFTEGKIEYRQTTNGTWWDRKLLNSNSSTNSYIGNSSINEYISGNQLNISSAYNNLLNSAPSVVLGRFSEIMLFPSLSLKSTSWNYLSIEARYVNIDIYAPNFSGQCRAVLSDNGLYNDETNPNLTIVEFTKNGDYFNIRFDSDNLKYLCYIEFSLPYVSSSQTYQVPNYATSNTNDTTTWNLYNLGYDDGYNAQRGEIEGLKANLENANSSVNVLKQRVNDLQDQVNNNFGFKNIFFAMADTPFKTVSNFLGFELFGVNLFQALIGFITVLACIWLIKKLI